MPIKRCNASLKRWRSARQSEVARMNGLEMVVNRFFFFLRLPLLPFFSFFLSRVTTERASRRTNIANNGAIKTGGSGVSPSGWVIKMKTEDGTFEIRMRFGTLPFNPFNVVGRIL